MKSSLEEIIVQLPDVHRAAQFNKIDLFLVLQALVGFVTGTTERDSLALLGTTLTVIGHFASRCKTGTLQDNKEKLKKWLMFGMEYAALKDSSDLDFDKMDVGSVPEVMKVKALRKPTFKYIKIHFSDGCHEVSQESQNAASVII